MAETLLEKRRRLPMRECTLCGQEKAVLQLRRVRGSWLCAPCFREHVVHARRPARECGDGAAKPDAGAVRAATGTAAVNRVDEAGSSGRTSADGRQAPDPNLLWTLHVVDAGFRYGGLVLRILVYGGLYALAGNTGFGQHLMAGFLLADGVTWVIGAPFDFRFHRLSVVAETLFFGVMFFLWLKTGWSFPDHPADRAILALAALATFTGKVGKLAAKLTR